MAQADSYPATRNGARAQDMAQGRKLGRKAHASQGRKLGRKPSQAKQGARKGARRKPSQGKARAQGARRTRKRRAIDGAPLLACLALP